MVVGGGSLSGEVPVKIKKRRKAPAVASLAETSAAYVAELAATATSLGIGAYCHDTGEKIGGAPGGSGDLKHFGTKVNRERRRLGRLITATTPTTTIPYTKLSSIARWIIAM